MYTLGRNKDEANKPETGTGMCTCPEKDQVSCPLLLDVPISLFGLQTSISYNFILCKIQVVFSNFIYTDHFDLQAVMIMP